MRLSRSLPFFLAAALLIAGPLPAQAGEPGAPASLSVEPLQTKEAQSIIRLTPNKTKILKLERDAASIILSNPRHASVMIDSPRLLIVVPRAPGATALTVLDNNGDVIAERDIIVTGQEDRYVRIRKYCPADDATCRANSIYYCPDNCYVISTESDEQATAAGAAVPDSINSPAPNTSANDDNDDASFDEDINPDDSPDNVE